MQSANAPKNRKVSKNDNGDVPSGDTTSMVATAATEKQNNKMKLLD